MGKKRESRPSTILPGSCETVDSNVKLHQIRSTFLVHNCFQVSATQLNPLVDSTRQGKVTEPTIQFHDESSIQYFSIPQIMPHPSPGYREANPQYDRRATPSSIISLLSMDSSVILGNSVSCIIVSLPDYPRAQLF